MRRGALLLLVVLPVPVWGQAADRQDVLKAFQELKGKAQESLKGIPLDSLRPDYIPVPKGKDRDSAGKEATAPRADRLRTAVAKLAVKTQLGNGQIGDARILVQVWGELEDGRKVHLEKYKWAPREELHLCFETAVPIKFGLYQIYPGKDTMTILPDKNYPKSFDTIMPGSTYRVPYTLETDNDNEDETISINIVRAGSDEEPVLQGPTFSAKGARDYGKAMFQLHKNARKLRVASGGRQSGRTADEVSIIVIGEGNSGKLQMTLHKK
jgi:hypothetical protein